MKYRVEHRTTYTYDDDVTDSFGIAYLTPRELSWQRVIATTFATEPAASDQSGERDYYGNTAVYFQVTEPHQKLTIVGLNEVEVHTPFYDEDALRIPWEDARPSARSDQHDAWEAEDFVLASSLVDSTPEAKAYAAVSLTPGRAIGEAVTDLMHRIYRDFTYKKGATTVTTTIDDVFDKRAGVCQDFAHLTLACLRAHGLAVRYVSGYLATQPPPGKERIVGADATHAWAACWIPGGGWLAVDPTNDQWANDRYVTVAWGRDYGDVPPVKGVIFTEAKESTLRVTVDVAPLPA